MTQENNQKSTWLPTINGLRGVAVLLVFGFHFEVPLFESGYWGVDLFFWISGFLITSGFLREYTLNRELNRKFGWIDIRYYFIRRARRILPLSFLVLVVVASVVYFFGDSNALSQTLRRFPRILSFTFNMQLQGDSQDYFLKSFQDFGLLHYWSLSVEEQIYILSPFLFLFAVSFHGFKLFGYRSTWHQRVLGLNIILCVASFYFMLKKNEDDSIVNYYSTFSRFWQFGLGAIIATLVHMGFHKRFSNQIRLYLSQVSSWSMIFSFILLENQGFGPLVLIPLTCTSIFVLFCVTEQRRSFLVKVLNSRMFQFFGDIAFPLYLVHWPAMILLRSFPNRSSLLNILIYLTAITAVSYLLHRYVEKPTMKMDISRFRSAPADSLAINHPRGARRRRKITIITLLSLIASIAILSYPKESKQNFSEFYSLLNATRYGKVSGVNGTAETVPDFSAAPETPRAKPTINPGATIAPEVTSEGSDSPVDRKPSPTPLVTKTEEQIDEKWQASLSLSTQTLQVKANYASNQRRLMEDLRKSWFSGCLDSKSAESACVEGSGEKEIVLLGDSFSFALKDAIVKSMPSGWRVRILTKGSCLPWNVTQYKTEGTKQIDCVDHKTWTQEYIAASRPEMIIASGADQWFSNSSFDQWVTGFRSAVKFYLANSKKVVIVSSAPGSGNLQNCVSADLSLRKCFGFPGSISKFVEIQKRDSQSLKFEFINLIDYLCISSCPAVIYDTPVYADGSHLSVDFSKKFSEAIKNLRLFG